MKKLVCFALAVMGVLTASAAFAIEGPSLTAQAPLQPVPDAVSSQPVPSFSARPVPGQAPIPVESAGIPLAQCVKYKDKCKIAPCAVPMVVLVKDPCAKCTDRCATPPCVAVEICVPPCSTCPPKVTCRRNGEYVKYDFGKYRVEIRSKNGVVRVDYDA
ncbi:MAG: hypothetical protein JSS02_24040 [Planctomycetes bacterium]|nr:hypothetical protein [Planctomycetota bacterium]